MIVSLFLLAGFSSSQIAGQTSQQIYITSSPPTLPNPNNVNGLTKNPTTGAPTTIPGSPFNERLDGAAMAIDALGRFLFVANPADNDISMFSIDPNTGALTEVPNSPFATPPYLNPNQAPTNPVAIATEKSGHFLYVAYTNGSNPGFSAINGFSIDSVHQALVPTAQMGLDITANPFGMATDPLGRNLYVGQEAPADNSSLQTGIQVYQIDPSSGALTYTSQLLNGDIGYCLVMDPLGRAIFWGHGQLEGYLSGATISNFDGSLQTLIGQISLDPPPDIDDFPYVLAIDASGKFLYAETKNYLHIFSLDPSTGIPTELPNSPLPPTLSRYSVADPQGEFIYSASASEISVFQVDTSTGLLSQISGSPFPISGNAAGILDIKISGTPSAISPVSAPLAQFDQTKLTFGPATDGSPLGPLTVHLTNNGSAPLIISPSPNLINVTGANPSAFSESDNCTVTLAVGASCTVNVTFTPTLVQTYSAMLSVTDNSTGSPQTVSMTGSGVAPAPGVSYSPSALTFTPIPANTNSSSQNIMVSSVGNAPLILSGVSLGGPNPDDFTFSNGCVGPIPVNSNCSIAVTFAPKAVGLRTAQLLIGDNVIGSSISISLSGTATDPFGIGTATSGTTSATITAGATAQYNLQLNPAAGFSGLVSVQCAGAPTSAVCNVNPPNPQINGSPMPITVTVSTTGTSQLPPLRITPFISPWDVLQLYFVFALVLALFAALIKIYGTQEEALRRRTLFARFGALAAPTVLIMASMTLGCGGSGGINPPPPSPTHATPTPAGTYTLVVTATSGTVTEQIQLSLTVN
jgi:6-phosphogluconolactonase (cycloisomerase 2 family)